MEFEFEVDLNASDNEEIDFIELEILDTTDRKVASSQLKEAPWQYTFSLENEGNYTLKVKAVDMVGNFTEKTRAFVVNNESITIISPNGGESGDLSSSQFIRWSSGIYDHGYVSIQLYSGSSYVASISNSTRDDGAFLWSIPSSIETGEEYRVRVYSTLDSDIQGYSDSYFSIGSGNSSTITVIQPNGGESWDLGSSQNIVWGSNNVSSDVSIKLYYETSYIVTISPSTANDGTFLWNIPSTLTPMNNYKVRIHSTSDLDIEDYSDNYFSIRSGSSSSINVNTPNGGETWTLGSSQNITWSSNNFPGYIGIQLYSGTNYVTSLSSSTANDGSFTWNVPSSITPGDEYRVRIYSTTDPEIQDFSDSYFSISSEQTEDPPNDDCNIPHSTTGTTFTYVNPEQNIYNFGDTYTATLFSSLYSVGQQGGAVLRLNENTVYNFGSWLDFNSNGSRDFTLPSQSDVIVPSNCYTLVIIGYNLQDEYVSEPFTIY